MEQEQIELVIRLNKEDYDQLCDSGFNGYSYLTNNVVEAISNGKPLPKGHGDLIDRNELVVDHTSYDWDDYVSMEQIMNADVVVEADKEG